MQESAAVTFSSLDMHKRAADGKNTGQLSTYGWLNDLLEQCFSFVCQVDHNQTWVLQYPKMLGRRFSSTHKSENVCSGNHSVFGTGLALCIR